MICPKAKRENLSMTIKRKTNGGDLSRYNLDESKENFNILKKVIKKKEYSIYEEIFKLIETRRIIELKSRSIIIETDAENNSKLLDDISKKYFIKEISQRRVEKKIGHGYVLGNLFITLKIDFY